MHIGSEPNTSKIKKNFSLDFQFSPIETPINFRDHSASLKTLPHTVCSHGTLRKWSILDLKVSNERFLHIRKIPPKILMI